MGIYVKRILQFEAYQWDGSVPFRPVEGFTPEIFPEKLRSMSDQHQLVHSRCSSTFLNKGCYIMKDSLGKYHAMDKTTFEATYELYTGESV